MASLAPPRYRKVPNELLAVLAGVVFLASGVAAGSGLVFHVGGPRGWRVPDGNTSYGWWATKNRFHVGDALYFRYDNDSVLVVDRQDYDGCDTAEPIHRFTDGNTTFTFNRTGFFCFISGDKGHCDEGQRLIVRVMVHPGFAAPAPAAAGPGPQPGGSSGSSPSPGGRRSSGWPATSGAHAVATGVSALTQGMVAMLSLVLFFQ